jgi:SAM-dependent methyltransferase
VTDKYAPAAEGWSEEQYADSHAYLAHRAELIAALGPELAPGDTVLDLACGDGGLADYLHGSTYLGVDASPEMVAAAERRGRNVVLGDLNEYVPPQPVAATTCFRAIYYARDRRAFFERVAGYTEKKLVFDLNPRQYPLAQIRKEIAAAGWARLDTQPFFVPQTVALPRPLQSLLIAAESARGIADLFLRFRFTYLCMASKR